MNTLAVIFLVLFIPGGIFGIIIFLMGLDGDDSAIRAGIGIFLSFFIPTLIVWLLNLYAFPDQENRYVPDTRIAVSMHGVNSTENKADLPVDDDLDLQIRISVQSNSFARRFFHDNKIPVTITISDPGIAQYQLQLSRNFEETKPPETVDNAVNYFFTVYAEDIQKMKKKGEPVDAYAAIITFVGKAVKEGTQTVRVKYGGKVSGKYERVDSLTFKSYDY